MTVAAAALKQASPGARASAAALSEGPSPLDEDAPSEEQRQPLFKFGLLSDVQHADMDDGASFHGTPRYYRYRLLLLRRWDHEGSGADVPGLLGGQHPASWRLRASPLPARRYALCQLDAAVDAMSAAGVAFCLHLGDLIDFHNSRLGVCADTELHHSEKALRVALQHFDRLGRPTLHLLGATTPLFF